MLNNRKYIFLKMFLTAVLVSVILSGCGSNSGVNSDKRSHMDAPEDIAVVYKANCVSCHGSDLQGRIGPNTNLQQVGTTMSEQDIVQQIEQGEANGSMRPFKDVLTDEEIAGLAAWLAGKTE